MRERKTGVEKSKPSGREKSRESGKRFGEKIERGPGAQVKYQPENRTVFINRARKSVFMEFSPGRCELFGPRIYVAAHVRGRRDAETPFHTCARSSRRVSYARPAGGRLFRARVNRESRAISLEVNAARFFSSLSLLSVSCFFLPLFSPFDANSCLLNSNAECTSLGLVFPGEFVQFGIEKTWDLWILNFTRGLPFPYSSPARQWDICINAIFGYASRRFRVTSHRVVRKSFFSPSPGFCYRLRLDNTMKLLEL